MSYQCMKKWDLKLCKAVFSANINWYLLIYH